MSRDANSKPGPAVEDELPPQAPEAEKAVLGCCLLDPQCIPDALEALPDAKAFYDLRNALVWEAITRLYADGKAVDTILVHQWLKDQGALEKVGGAVALAQLVDTAGTASNLQFYVSEVREKWLLRQTAAAISRAHLSLKQPAARAGAVIEELIGMATELGERHTSSVARRLGDWAPEIEERIEAFHRGSQQLLGYATGFRYLDNMLCGFIPGDYYILAARPSVGKTALAMQLAAEIAGRMSEGQAVGVFSLEMTGRALAEREWFGRSGANLQKYRNGFLVNADIEKLVQHRAALGALPVYVDDTSALNVQQLAIKARRMKRQLGCQMFVVDYLQLLEPEPGRESENRNYELGRISKRIKALAKELQCPFLVLAQMNRDWEKDPTRKPQMSDLRDSGQVEADADCIMFLYDANLKKFENDLDSPPMRWLRRMPGGNEEEVRRDWKKHFRRINLLVAKQRNGPTGDVELVYHKKLLRFLDAHADSEDTAGAANQEML